ncbi:MAG TPA: histidine--tRNA ligase [Deltaproteobacteria bacterium]|nr:histidine--tRNA ligase [Deltaproteobacteria bacterium]HOS27877.1 histidine--tRNA ligase [Deltaproteobacteria bacterium]HPL85860.1 histidine--tRNA ligase [Deltaproteobacteria bacterium]
MEVKAIRGMNDILPREIPKWRFVEETARKIFRLFGYVELRTPVLERTELFLRGIGDETDVVEKQMYTFTDKSGSSVSMRPEATASVLRAAIEHGLLSEDPIRKLFSIGPMFRYERPQKGRYRQFHQINAERLGESGPFSDAETLQLAYVLATSLGLSGVSMEVNSLGCEICREEFKKALKTYLGKRADQLCADCARRVEKNPLRVLDCKVDACRQAALGAPGIEDFLCAQCRDHYAEVLSYLDTFGVPYQKNPSLVRGLDYYTRTTFEITASGLGSQNAVAGGGRYDNLVKILGGPDVSGIGFAFGLERIILLLEEKTQEEEGCFVVAQGSEHVRHAAAELLSELRSAGIASEAVLEKSFKAQMRRAGKSGYPLCAIIGEDEVEKSLVTIKDLRTSSQIQAPRKDAQEKIRSLLKGRQGEHQ